MTTTTSAPARAWPSAASSTRRVDSFLVLSTGTPSCLTSKARRNIHTSALCFRFARASAHAHPEHPHSLPACASLLLDYRRLIISLLGSGPCTVQLLLYYYHVYYLLLFRAMNVPCLPWLKAENHRAAAHQETSRSAYCMQSRIPSAKCRSEYSEKGHVIACACWGEMR